MKSARRFLAIACLLLANIGTASAQTDEPSSAGTAPPKLLVLTHQEFLPGKAAERAKLEVAMSRVCEKVNVPNAWIDLEAITGRPEALSFDPFDSFAAIDHASAEWPKLYARNPEIAPLQAKISALIASERTVIAVRRDDLGYRVNSINLAEAHAMRVLEVRLNPGHENDFVDAFKTLAAAYEKMSSDLPWVVYQVNAGMPSPSFLVFAPMVALRQNDDLLERRKALQEAEGEEGSRRMQQIAREAYASTESNVYVVSPEMSHVTKEFAAENPEFWLQKVSPEGPKPAINRPAPKDPKEKQR